MRKKQNIRQSIETPTLGFGVVLLTLLCFLLALWALFTLVRFLVG